MLQSAKRQTWLSDWTTISIFKYTEWNLEQSKYYRRIHYLTLKMHCKHVALFLWQAMRKIFYRHPLHESSKQPYELQTNISIFQRRKLRLQNCVKSHILWKAQLLFISRFCLVLVFLHDSFPNCLESRRLGIWELNWYLSCTSPPWVASSCNLIQREQGTVVGVWSHTGKRWILTLLFPFYLALVISSQWRLFPHL